MGVAAWDGTITDLQLGVRHTLGPRDSNRGWGCEKGCPEMGARVRETGKITEICSGDLVPLLIEDVSVAIP